MKYRKRLTDEEGIQLFEDVFASDLVPRENLIWSSDSNGALELSGNLDGESRNLILSTWIGKGSLPAVGVDPEKLTLVEFKVENGRPYVYLEGERGLAPEGPEGYSSAVVSLFLIATFAAALYLIFELFNY